MLQHLEYNSYRLNKDVGEGAAPAILSVNVLYKDSNLLQTHFLSSLLHPKIRFERKKIIFHTDLHLRGLASLVPIWRGRWPIAVAILLGAAVGVGVDPTGPTRRFAAPRVGDVLLDPAKQLKMAQQIKKAEWWLTLRDASRRIYRVATPQRSLSRGWNARSNHGRASWKQGLTIKTKCWPKSRKAATNQGCFEMPWSLSACSSPEWMQLLDERHSHRFRRRTDQRKNSWLNRNI